MLNDIVKYHFAHRIYFSLKDIKIGFMLGSVKELIHGLMGRVWFVSFSLLLIHIDLRIIRSGHRKRSDEK